MDIDEIKKSINGYDLILWITEHYTLPLYSISVKYFFFLFSFCKNLSIQSIPWICRFVDYSFCWLFDLLIIHFVDYSICWLFDLLIIWFVDYSICWMYQLIWALNCLAPCTLISLGTPILSRKYRRHFFTYSEKE